MTVQELRDKLDAGEDIRLIDVREPYENEEYNVGGLNIPLADLGSRIEEIRDLSAQGDIILYCRSGNRSQMAQKILASQFNLTNTQNLEGGMNAWREMERNDTV